MLKMILSQMIILSIMVRLMASKKPPLAVLIMLIPCQKCGRRNYKSMIDNGFTQRFPTRILW